MKNERDLVRVRHMLDAIARIKRFLADLTLPEFMTDELRQSAVIRQFEIIGEAATMLSPAITSVFPAVPWREMKAFRNLLIHEYFRVDAAEVWTVYANDLTGLENQLAAVEEYLAAL